MGGGRLSGASALSQWCLKPPACCVPRDVPVTFQYLKNRIQNHPLLPTPPSATLLRVPETAIYCHEHYQLIAYSTKVMAVHGSLGYVH
jgi:hypothetical protein